MNLAKKWKNKHLLDEIKHIKKNHPSSKNWSREQKKMILNEFERRKRANIIRSDAGKKRKKRNHFEFRL